MIQFLDHIPPLAITLDHQTLELIMGVTTCIIIGTAYFFWLYMCHIYHNKSAENEFKLLSRMPSTVLILTPVIVIATGYISYSIYQLSKPQADTNFHSILSYTSSLSYFELILIPPSLVAIFVAVITFMQSRKLMAQTMSSHNFVQNIMDAISDPIFVKDKNHVYKFGNKAFWNLTGSGPEKYLGKNDQDIFPAEEVAIFWEKDDLVVRNNIIDINEENVTSADGKTIIALTTKSPLQLPNGSRGLVGIIHDVTSQKQIERELAKHRDHLQQLVEEQVSKIEEEKLTITLLQNISSIANEAANLRLALRPVLSVICNYMQFSIGHAYLYDDTHRDFSSGKIWHLAHDAEFTEFKALSEATRFTANVGVVGQVIATHKPILINWQEFDESQHPRAKCVKQSGLKSMISFPILNNGIAVAVLEFFSEQEYRADEKNIGIFESIGAQLSVVAQRERTERSLLKAMMEARKANLLKSEFLANISHELRTPMHAIITFSRQGIERKSRWNSDEQAENLALIKESGERLLLLLNDLLDLSKLEAGAVSYNFEAHDIQSIVQKAASQLQGLLHDRKISLQALYADHLEPVCCDEGKIHQVLSNLLFNAIKFSPNGKSITISCYYDTINPSYMHLEVADQGLGIPEDELESVFDKFVQSSKTKSGAGGTGLGLAICAEIITGHRGRIWAENHADGGACFHIIIPFQQLSES